MALDVLDSLLEGCQVIGSDWTYVYVNETVAAQAGRAKAELLGRTMMTCFPGIDATPMFATLVRCMEHRVHERLENEFVFPDGSRGWFELRFVPVPEGVCILSLDISAAKRTALALAWSEEQLRQAQKMEAIGRLAGGVAHDFNNLLSVILSYTEMLLEERRPEEPIFADLEEIKKAGERGADLTRQLLLFSRKQVVSPQRLSLDDVVASMSKMVRRLLGEDIELRISDTPELGLVMADRGHLEQVIMNLAVNARDAMSGGGTLSIESRNVVLDADHATSQLGLEPGPHVMLAVRDTGSGMDRETRQRIFEPFFTTKERGKGTGFGLSTVFSIVRQNGGTIAVYSELGKGTSFEIFWPRVDADTLAEPSMTQAGEAGGSATVLLVEDEAQLRAVALGILTRGGYRVLEAASGSEAIRVCEQHEGSIDLLLTDVVLPLMSGPQIAERLAVRRPGMKVLYMTGYTEDRVGPRRALTSQTVYLQKPITPRTLLRGVREALEAAP